MGINVCFQEIVQSVRITLNKVEVTSLNLLSSSCTDMSKKKKKKKKKMSRIGGS
jgi:hypothetical protein